MTPAGMTAVIVSRGLDALLRLALEHLARAWPRPFDSARDRIVVVDNASPTPYQPARLLSTGLRLLRLDNHHGFGAASNLGARAAPADCYLFLNNDVLLHPDALRHMAAGLALHRVGTCGTRLVFPNDTIQHGGVVFSAGERGPYHRYRDRPTDSVPRADAFCQAVTGACMLVRRETFDEVGGFDESYPFGLEDVDFCLKARQAGWLVRCCHAVDSLHFESMTEGRVELNRPSHRLFMERWRGKFSIDG